MKNLIIIISFICLLAGSNKINAQTKFYLGGDVSYAKSWNGDEFSDFSRSLSVSPEFGFQLKERWMVGARLSYASVLSSTGGTLSLGNVSINVSRSLSAFNINPYARLRFFELNKINFWLEGNIFYGEGNDNSTSFASAGVNPMITYEANEHIMLYSSLNLIAINYTYIHYYDSKYPANSINQHSLSFGASTNEIIKMSDFSIGFLYRF